jgi:hypothetical protein
MLHREPVIELIGVDPYKFAEIRSLGLLNEQIDWKQRFFVPTDEVSGVGVVSALLDRYPILPSEESGESGSAYVECQKLSPPQTVNLDEWFVPVADMVPVPPLAPPEIANIESESALFPSHLAEAIAPAPRVTETQLALNFG